MPKLKLTGQNLSEIGCMHDMQLYCYEMKLPSLKLKTRLRQLLGYVPSDTMYPCFLVKNKEDFVECMCGTFSKNSLGYSDIDFFNFQNRQVQNFKISNQSK
jgi:hypothetical protein